MGGRTSESLGSDSVGLGKALYFAFMAVYLSTAFLFNLTNFTEPSRTTALVYSIFLVFGVALIGLDLANKARKKEAELPDTLTSEGRSPLLGWEFTRGQQILIAGVSLLLGGALFLLLGGQSTEALIAAPTFSLIQPGPVESASQSGGAGLIENLWFFAVLMPTTFVILHRVTRQRLLSIFLALLAATAAFTGFHYAVYGEDNSKLDQVAYFGAFCGGSVLVTGTTILCDSVHFWNNFGVVYFRNTAADLTLWILLYMMLVSIGTYAGVRKYGLRG